MNAIILAVKFNTKCGVVQLTKYLSDNSTPTNSLEHTANLYFLTHVSRYLFVSQCLSSCMDFSQIWKISVVTSGVLFESK